MAERRAREVSTDALARLMSAGFDPAGMSDEELVAAHAGARDAKKRAEGVVAAELSRRGKSWREIGKLLGVDHTTAYGWAKPYLSRAGLDE